MMYLGQGSIKLLWDRDSPSLNELFFPGKRITEANFDKWMTVVKKEGYNESDLSYLRVNFWFQVRLQFQISYLSTLFIFKISFESNYRPGCHEYLFATFESPE